jgi:alkaline phosphatase D
VASGDPLPDGVVLWARWSPPRGAGASAAASTSVDVRWQVARDPELGEVVAQGTARTGPDLDHTLHVDVRGLEPATTYWYRFQGPGGATATSPVGRARTAPALGASTANLRLGLVACASLPAGRFHAYRNLAARDIDLVVHVGDYIYENDRHARTEVRPHQPRPAATSLAHYRARHAQYKADPHLQALHARHPMVAVWDDHEVAGGAWREGAAFHDDRRDGPWAARRAAAVRAYREWMPVRWPGEGDRVYRSLRWGDLVDLVMLDTRLIGRDRPVHGGDRVVVGLRERDRHKSLLGPAQREWLAAELAASTARWRVVGNQVVLAPTGLVAGRLVNPGQWDGYPEERDWLYQRLAAAGGNAVVLSGDIHSSWAMDLPVGAELVTPSVSSPSFASILVPGGAVGAKLGAGMFRWQNRHVKFVELRRHGYVVVDLTPERVQADWWHVDSVREPSPAERWASGWRLDWGSGTGLVRAPAPLGER